MKIIVLIKQVPDTGEVKIDPETNTLVRKGVPSIVNPFDLYAVEEALRLKEKMGGKVFALTMGPPQAEEALKEVISMGVDEGILVSDIKLAGSDTYATSYSLACAIRKIENFDLIICGKQAIDGDTGQVGPGVAEWLSIPQATLVRKITKIEGNEMEIESLWEDRISSYRLKLPALITVVKEINVPRLPSLRGKMRAKKYEVIKWNVENIEAKEDKIGLNGSPTQVVEIFTPPPKTEGIKVEGVEQGVNETIKFLKKIGVV